MGKIISTFFLLTTFLFTPLIAEEIPHVFSGKRVLVEAGEEIRRDYYAAGNNVSILGTVYGDVYLFGAQVQIEGTVHGDVIVMGGGVDISGTVSHDIKVLGGYVSLSGEVGRNVSIAGGSVDLAESAKINGGVYGNGGTFRLAAPVKGDVDVICGSYLQTGKVMGKVDVISGDIRLTPDAVIEGDFSYWSDKKVSISRKASISGKVEKKLGYYQPSTKKVIDAFSLIYWVSKYITFISLFILGLLIYYFYPKYMDKTDTILQNTPWMALVTGILTLIIPPVLMVILTISVVGIPIAIILLFLYALGLYVANVFTVNFIGRSLTRLFHLNISPGWVFFLGAFIYSLIAAIPLVGYVFTFLAFLLGLGGLVMAKREELP